MVKRWFTSLFDRVWHRRLIRSGMVPGAALVLLVLGLGFAYRERGRGHLSKLKAEMNKNEGPPPTVAPRPGGQEALLLTRPRLVGGSMPEFLSVTMLPGRGMNILQITAYIPNKGEVKLLASPSVEDAERAMTGRDKDEGGQASLEMGSAFEVPWADRLGGTSSPGGGHVTTVWRGRSITLPQARSGGPASVGGLMLAATSDSADTAPMPDGGQAIAVFHANDFGAHWPSQTDVTVSVLLSSQWIELTVVARNRGDSPEPIGIGWHPRFAIDEGGRSEMTLRLPSQTRTEVRASGVPTGNLVTTVGTPYDFSGHTGTALGMVSLDDTYVDLRQELLDNGPAAELHYPSGNYGLRLTALSHLITAFHVEAPAAENYVSIEPQFNYEDPFGKEWSKDKETGMVVLQPGESTQWKARLELIRIPSGG